MVETQFNKFFLTLEASQAQKNWNPGNDWKGKGTSQS